MKDQIILIDEKDQVIGIVEKMAAHKKGLLHRAFSVVIFNSKGEMLLQKRANSKYHCGGLWTNACCSHPRLGENILKAAKRRLFEEMGIACELRETFSFQYCITFSNGLTENEFDHVFVGKSDDLPDPDSKEVEDSKWLEMKTLKTDIKKNPESYTYWFKILVKKLPHERG